MNCNILLYKQYQSLCIINATFANRKDKNETTSQNIDKITTSNQAYLADTEEATFVVQTTNHSVDLLLTKSITQIVLHFLTETHISNSRDFAISLGYKRLFSAIRACVTSTSMLINDSLFSRRSKPWPPCGLAIVLKCIYIKLQFSTLNNF